ncbi:MAG: hypothetical protein ACPLPT_10045 [Moorellales bacterium]
MASGLVGMWKDREDIGDSVAYARYLRQQAERRGRDYMIKGLKNSRAL